EHRNQIFRARQNEDIRFDGVVVLWQALVSFARDGWKGKAPAEPKRSVASTGVIIQRKLRAETGASGARRNGHRHRARAGGWVGSKFSTDAADRAAALGQCDRGGGNGEAACCRIRDVPVAVPPLHHQPPCGTWLRKHSPPGSASDHSAAGAWKHS